MGLHHDVANNEPPAAAHCCKHSGEELMPAPEKAAWTGLTHSKSIASTAHYGCAKFACTQGVLAVQSQESIVHEACCSMHDTIRVRQQYVHRSTVACDIGH